MASDDAAARPLKRAKSATSGLSLQVSKFDSEYQFRNAWFPLSVYIVDAMGQLKTGGGDMGLTLSLECVEEEEKVVTEISQDLFQIDPKTPAVVVNGRATLRCRITECSMNEGNRRFCIRVATSAEHDESTYVKTGGVFVINHALKLADDLEWPEEWYKDEGGRDKCITVGVELRDASGKVVTTRKVPLKVMLFYQTGTPVGRQDILKLNTGSTTGGVSGSDASASAGMHAGGGGGGSNGGSTLCVVNGHAEVKARIDEVSRSHQGWGFMLRIGPDVAKYPLDNDVFSPLVTVRSKRNNRKKGGNSSSNNLANHSSSYDADAATAAAAVAMMSVQYGGGGSNTPTAAMPPPPPPAPSLQQPQPPQYDERPPQAIASSTTTVAPLPPASHPNYQDTKSSPLPLASLAPPLPPSSSSDVASMQEALTSVLGWIDSTLKDVQSLKWQQLGHERGADGGADLSRPLYSISNPNDAVDRILHTYEENVMGSLHTILEKLEPILNHSASPPVDDHRSSEGGSEDDEPDTTAVTEMAPPMQRQVSTPYTGDSMAAAAAVPAPYPFADNGAAAEAAAAVSTIVAKIFVCKNSQGKFLKMGLPSFDKTDKLVGFYEVSHNNSKSNGEDDALPSLKFRSLALAVQAGHVSGEEKGMAIATQSLVSERSRGSLSVFAKDAYRDDLIKVKEAAAAYFWAQGGEQTGGAAAATPGHEKSAAGDLGFVFDI